MNENLDRMTINDTISWIHSEHNPVDCLVALSSKLHDKKSWRTKTLIAKFGRVLKLNMSISLQV
jgi:hypothetical protein